MKFVLKHFPPLWILVKKISSLLQADNPSGAELNVLQIYIITSLIFVVGTLIQFAFVLLWRKISGNANSTVVQSLAGERTKNRNMENVASKVTTNSIDTFSLALFVFSYVLFNVIYWIYCCFHWMTSNMS